MDVSFDVVSSASQATPSPTAQLSVEFTGTNFIVIISLAQELVESRRRELQAKRLQREKEQQVNIRQRQMEEIERRAQYAAEMEQKRERSEAILRDRETTIQKVHNNYIHE